MKDWLKENILGLLILVGIVSLIVIILFQKPRNNDAFYEYQLKQARDSAKGYQPAIDSLTKIVNAKPDKDYAHSDSLSNVSIEATNKILYELRQQKKNIHLDSLNSSGLFRFYTGL